MILALLVGLALLLFVFILVLFPGLTGGGSHNRRFKSRLAKVRGVKSATMASGAKGRNVHALARESPTPGLDRIAARWLPRVEQLRNRLERAGPKLTLGRYMLWSAVVAVFALGLAKLGLRLAFLPSLLIGCAAGIGLPHWYLGRLGRKRVNQFIGLFPDAIDLIVRALRSGLPISEAIVNAGREIADPVGSEFRRIDEAMKLGRTLDDELWEIARRLDTPDFGFFVISLSVQRQTGGNLGETLANLSEVLRRRRQMRAKIKAISSEARMSAMILGVLPFLVALMIFITTPTYLVPLFTQPAGLALSAIGAAMLLTGVFIMSRLIRFEI